MNEMLTCQALIDFLDDYVEERLTAPERARFEEHLAVCPACVRYLNGYRGTMTALARIGRDGDALPADVPPRLVEAILAARRASC
jgi:anti-sigma factor RsiW